MYLNFLGNSKKRIGLERIFDEQLDKILVNGKPFLKQKITINNSENEEDQEAIRIYASEEMLNILEDKNYNHFFLDGTFKCVPKGEKTKKTQIKIEFYNF